MRPEAPYKLLADWNSVDQRPLYGHDTIKYYVKRARSLGLLTTRPRNRAGGELTIEAIYLLSEDELRIERWERGVG